MEREYSGISLELDRIAETIRKIGEDPLAQLHGYAATGDPRYVTRSGGAREAIQKIPQSFVLLYVLNLKKVSKGESAQNNTPAG